MIRRARARARRHGPGLLARTLIAALLLQTGAAALPPPPVAAPLGTTAAAAETLDSPRYVAAAVMPNGQVGLVFANGDNGVNTAAEIRFVAYSSEHALLPSLQLSTAGPAYPQLATFRGRLVAGYVDSRGADDGRFIIRVSDDSGATWSAETYPFGSETFDRWTLAPRLVASRDGQTLRLFDAASGSRPRYRSTTDPDLVTWTSPSDAGDTSMVAAQTNSCGSSGQECYRAHAFSFMETATAGTWIYVAKSPAGSSQSGRGTQVGTLGGSWSVQTDHGGSGDAQGCCGHSTATTFLDRVGNIYYLRAGSSGESLYWKRSSDGGYSWTAELHLYETQPNYTTGAPVGLYVPGYTFGEYLWYAGFGGSEDSLRVVPLRTASSGAEFADVDLLQGAITYTATGSGLAGVDFTPAFDADDATKAVFSQVNNATSQLVVALPGGAGTVRSIRVRMTVLHLAGLSGGGDVKVFCGSGTGGGLLWSEHGANVHVVNTGRVDVSACTSSQLTLWWSHANGGTGCGDISPSSCLYTLRAWAYGLGAEAGPLPYAQTGSARLLGSAGGDLDPGAAYPYNYGQLARSMGAGAYTTTAVDLELPGRGLPFVFARTHNSANLRVGALGPAWTHSFEWTVSENGGLVTLRKGDGREHDFTRQPDGSYEREPGVFDEVVKNPDSTFTLTTREQVQYEFSSAGALLRIHEPAGNEIGLAYTSGRLATVTDTVGRAVTFSYDSSGRLVELRDETGRRVRYAYDAAGRLSAVGDTLAMSVAAAYRDEVLSESPVTYWRLGEAAGPTAADQMAAQDGAYGGSMTHGVAPAVLDADTAVDTNGSGYVTAGGSGVLNIAGTALSVEAWVRGGGQGTYKYIVSKSDSSGSVGYSLYTGNTGRLHFFVNTTGSGLRMAVAPSSPWTGTWRHVVGTYDGAAVRLYIDGVQVAATGASGSVKATTRNLDIGRFNGGGNAFNGDVDEVAVYGSVLSAQAVADHYAAGSLLPAASWLYAYEGTTQHLDTVTDPEGRVLVANDYDSLGRLSSQTDGAGKTTGFAYGTSEMTTTDPRGNATTVSYDARNRVVGRSSAVGAGFVDEEYIYDGCGNLSATIDPNGDRTDLTYDSGCLGNLLERQEPQLDPLVPRFTTTYTYDARNNVETVTDAKGFLTTYTYDPTSNVLLSVAREIDATTTAATKYEYGDAANPGLPTKVISPRGNLTGTPDYAFATTLAYDADGNLVSVTDPDGNTTTYGYDALGRRTSMVAPEGNAAGGTPADHTWTYVYDAGGRLIEERDPLGASTLHGYDDAGVRTSRTDRNGNLTTYVHDGAARLWKVQQRPDPAGQPALVYETVLGRDNSGNVIAVTQANGTVTTYGYDELDRLTSITTHPDALTDLTTSFGLDAGGNVIQRTNADGVAVSYSYDALDRLTEVSAAGLATITYKYDELGRRTEMADGSGTTTYSWDGLGRPTQIAQPNGTVSYAHDRDSNLTALTYPGPATVMYSYTEAGRLLEIEDWASRTTSYTDTPSGRVETVTLPNGMVTTYGYDRVGRVTSVASVVGSSTVTSHAYTLDHEGDRTALEEFVSGITTPGTADDYSMTYDGLRRLTGLGLTSAESFLHDPASNLTSRTGPTATYSYDEADRLTGDGAVAYTWSDASRLTARGADSFSYDPLDRLTGSTVASTSRSYLYSGDGLLQVRSQGMGDTELLWDLRSDPAPLLEIGSARIVHGHAPLYADDGTDLVVFAPDALGSVRAEVDATGAVTASFRYRAYGEIAQSSGASVPSYVGYAGELRDPSGLIYLRARWYEPATGRFLTTDPVMGDPATPASLNSYLYGHANPIVNGDPTGKWAGLLRAWEAVKAAGPTLLPILAYRVTLISFGAQRTYERATGTAASAPVVADPKLKNYLEHIYRGAGTAGHVGDGTTMAAIRYELATGKLWRDSNHVLKGQELVNGLTRWLREVTGASPSDRAIAQTLLDELLEALRRR